jgi:hypothetical protein
MTTQFRNFDSATRPQEVSIQWEMLTPRDDSGYYPTELDDGFWPSTHPGAAEYYPPERYAAALEAAKARWEEFQNGDWHYIGVIARAHISVPIGGDGFTTYTLDSAGLWGIESDGGAYLNEVFEEEKASLLHALKAIAAHVAAL